MNEKNQRRPDPRKTSVALAFAGPRKLILDNILYMKNELPALAAPEDFKELLSCLLFGLYKSVGMVATINDLFLDATNDAPEQLKAIKRRNLLALEVLHREMHVMDAVVRYLFDEAEMDDESEIGSISLLVSESMVNIFAAYGELHKIMQTVCDVNNPPGGGNV